MLLKDLKQTLFLPDKEIFINKIVKTRGYDVHLISITSEKHRNILWAMYSLPFCLDERINITESLEYASNLEEKINEMNAQKYSPILSISELLIQKKKRSFNQ